MFTLLCAAILSTAAADASSEKAVRFATFNVKELSRVKLDRVDAEGHGVDRQLRGAAEIVQRVRPDVLLINEIDFDAEGRQNARLFLERYLAVSQNGQVPVDYPHIFFGPTNTGVPTGLDLDNDGQSNGPGDAFGFGKYPGQYGMALFSRYPLDADHVRTFQKFQWRDMPDNLLPDGTGGKPAWYAPEVASQLRLSSKSHWDVPVKIGSSVVHLLCAHPTPPVFDGAEDRNGRRNFDEIRLWADYLSGGAAAGYLTDDQGGKDGLSATASFVILGDLNADPSRDPAVYGQPAIDQLLKHPRVRDTVPVSSGALGRNKPGPPKHFERRTCDFGRIDYVLPSTDLRVAGSGVFWPGGDEPLQALVTGEQASSDHRLVWVDVLLDRP